MLILSFLTKIRSPAKVCSSCKNMYHNEKDQTQKNINFTQALCMSGWERSGIGGVEFIQPYGHPHPTVTGNLPIKMLVARQQPRNKNGHT